MTRRLFSFAHPRLPVVRRPLLAGGVSLLLCGAIACTEEAQEPTGDGTAEEATAPAAHEPAHGTTFAEATDSGDAEFIFMYVPSSGFAYTGADGELTGVTVEILRDFAAFVEDTHGIDVTTRWLGEEEWSTFYQQVRHSTGGVFGIGNVTITEARRHELQFSPPYLSNVAVLVTHEDVPELEAMDELGEAFAELTGLPYPGTLHEERLLAIRDRHLPQMETREVSSNDELVSLLAAGDGYFGYIDVYNYWRAANDGAPLRRHEVGDDASEEFGIIFPLDSDWGPVMDAFFRSGNGYMASERYRQLLDEHLGGELAGMLTEADG